MGHDAHFMFGNADAQWLLTKAALAALLDWLEALPPVRSSGHGALVRLHQKIRLARVLRRARRASSGRAADASELARMIQGLGLGRGIFLNVGHDNLKVPVMQSLARAGLHRLAMLHDTIPLDHPQYARPGTAEIFRSKLDAMGKADALLCNSAHTAARASKHIGEKCPPRHVVPLGIDTLPSPSPAAWPAGYFLCVGTIEPRKNHAMLLDIWSGAYGHAPPLPLRIAGRRGWNNQAVFDRLDSDPNMARTVFEHAAPDDAALSALIRGAQALLFPSFAEGYGLPLAEALAAGVPVIAADIPALREVGGNVPEWLAPDDPAAWARVIQDYSTAEAPLRAAQIARLSHWTAPSWAEHFAFVENTSETILVQARQDG